MCHFHPFSLSQTVFGLPEGIAWMPSWMPSVEPIWLISNVGKTIIDHPIWEWYHLFIVIWGMVYGIVLPISLRYGHKVKYISTTSWMLES